MWEEFDYIPYLKTPDRVLRIVFDYRFNTIKSVYISLELLTKRGWKKLHRIQITDQGAELMTGEEGVQKLKDFADYLYKPSK